MNSNANKIRFIYGIAFACISLFFIMSCASETIEIQEPKPFGAIPSAQQLAWHELEYYAFIHFNINTFSDVEWGKGTENPNTFNPTELDCHQWAKVAKEAGMKGIIITAKHHNGFCLWPSKYTNHSVENSPWRGGVGDVMRELADACKAQKLKLGVYISPWDRNNPKYGTPEYNDYFKLQLEELLSSYGDIFEVWFDGANGEGPNGKKQEYDWPGFIDVVRKHQPNAVIFSDAGPDIRWAGTEKGFVNETNWATLNRANYYPGTPDYLDLRSGNKQGTHWLPAEVDVSTRPGWYYHLEEDSAVKSVDHLELIYYQSVGRNANLLLNLPVDRRGLIHEVEVERLMALKQRLNETFRHNLALHQNAIVSNTRQKHVQFSVQNVLDGDKMTYWAADDDITTATLEITLDQPTAINVISLKEYIPLGQRIESFSIEVKVGKDWLKVGESTTIGHHKLLKIPKVITNKVKINILSAMACPTLSEVGLYYAQHQNYLLEPQLDFENRMAWWRNAGFGMFIHWGLYAVPAGLYKGKKNNGAAEWLMNDANIPIAEYEEFATTFNPSEFDAEKWVNIAQEAGMKYIVMTAKHHDGFALWNSQISDYDIMDATPFKRDILKELSEACQKADLKFCLYYSIMDWHHPEAQSKNINFATYRDEYMYPQLKELIEQYQPNVLWLDGEQIPEWTEAQGKDLYQYIRTLNPNIIINNRVGKGRNERKGMNKSSEFVGDFNTPEQEILEDSSNGLDWETGMTMNDTWGFKKNDSNWKSPEILIHHLINVAAKGGNYLLNVGPTGEGIIPEQSIERLNAIGKWMAVNQEVIHQSTTWTHDREGDYIRFTSNAAGDIYAIALKFPSQSLILKSVRPNEDSEVELLGYSDALAWNWSEEAGLNIEIPSNLQNPEQRPCSHAWVFKIRGQPAP